MCAGRQTGRPDSRPTAARQPPDRQGTGALLHVCQTARHGSNKSKAGTPPREPACGPPDRPTQAPLYGGQPGTLRETLCGTDFSFTRFANGVDCFPPATALVFRVCTGRVSGEFGHFTAASTKVGLAGSRHADPASTGRQAGACVFHVLTVKQWSAIQASVALPDGRVGGTRFCRP